MGTGDERASRRRIIAERRWRGKETDPIGSAASCPAEC
jgi:hypothetical protein